MTIRDVRTDVNKVIALLEARSDKEKKLEALVKGMGGLDVVIKVGLPASMRTYDTDASAHRTIKN